MADPGDRYGPREDARARRPKRRPADRFAHALGLRLPRRRRRCPRGMGRGLRAARRSRPGDRRRQRRGRARRHAAERPRAPLPRRARDAPSADRRAGVAGGPRRGGRAGRGEGRAMRTAVVFGVLLCCVAVSVIVGALVGAVPLGPGEVLGAIGGHGDPGTLAIVRDLRLPRVVGAALIGGALAVAGTLLQGLLRNPLADPYVTGTSAGASLGAVATIAIGATAPFVLPFGAFAGAILAVAVTWRLAALGGRTTVLTVLLGGVVLSSFAGALLTFLIVASDRGVPRGRGDARARRRGCAERPRAKRAAGRSDHRRGRWTVFPGPLASRAAADARMTSLVTRSVTAGYGDRVALRDADLELRSGELVAVVGPNGAGKSTLIRVLAGLLRPRSGAVSLDGIDLRGLHRGQIARRIVVVPQVFDTLFPFSVREVVGLGRTARLGILGRASAADRAAVARAMRELDLDSLGTRPIDALSGGERQRALLAMALAQESDVLLLDEPTAHLDPAHQLATLDLLRRLAAERGLVVVAVLHDLNLASALASRVVVVAGGRVVSDGPPARIVNEELVRSVFGARLAVRPGDPPFVLPRVGGR